MELQESSSYQCLPAQEALALLEAQTELTLFDVRDMRSYQGGHLEKAMHLSEDRVPLWLGKLPKDRPVVIYCYAGNSSKAYAQMFSDFRFTRVVSVDGGYEALLRELD